MLFYTTPSSYLPRRSYRSAPLYQYQYDEPSSTFGLEDLGYFPLSRGASFPQRVDPETRYRRALHDLEAAEQEYEAHLALERARQVAVVRQRAAAEAARRERAQAIQAEVERIEHAVALQAQIDERFAQGQQTLGTRAAFGRVPLRRAPLHHDAVLHADTEGASAPQHRFAGFRQTCSQPSPSLALHDNGAFSFGDLLKLLAGAHPEPQAGSPSQGLTSQPRHPAEPEPEHKPESPKRDDVGVTLNDVLEFFHGIAAQARGAADGHKSTHESSASSQPEAGPSDGKGKGKAKAEPVPERTLLDTLVRERMKGALDQEIRDLEQAIKLSLQDRDASDAKKAHASKAVRSSAGASSSKVKIEERSSSGREASPARSPPVPTPAPEPVSPLTAIRAVRTQFSSLESGFKFPPVLDFDHSELAVSANNAPVRAYEHTLNGLLQQLDSIESDGDEEVRDVRREVVREVERALDDVERKVREQAPQTPIPEINAKEDVIGYDVGSEEHEVPTTHEDGPLADVTKDAKPPLLHDIASAADADIDHAITQEYQSISRSRSSEVVVAELNGAPAPAVPANEESSTLDYSAGAETIPSPSLESSLDSIATIIPAPAAPAPPATPPAAAETFLTSMSHDQFTFPPKPASSLSTGSGSAQDDAVLVDDSSEGGSVRGVDDGWSEVDA